MSLALHRPYPGVGLVVTAHGSLLLGAPTDAFKATKRHCAAHRLPFPRVLVAPARLLAHATPQFNPEFFLYDFLFVYGAAFRPELAHERLQCVVPPALIAPLRRTLQATLLGPSRAELASYRDANGRPCVSAEHQELLVAVGAHMAIKVGGAVRAIDDMVDFVALDAAHEARLFDGRITVAVSGDDSFLVRGAGESVHVALPLRARPTPFSILPPAASAPPPPRLGVEILGARSGFDLSGPSTGFVVWLNGQALVYDGPVGTRFLLEQQGIAASDIAGIVLSHCHEDHMGAFVELVLAGARPTLYTSEPIYRAALTKLACYFGCSEAAVATLLNYVRVTPGEPVDILGARCDFFYTVHAIPTLGMAASLGGGGSTGTLQISGDTLHHNGLDAIAAAGVLPPAYHARMRQLIPARRRRHALYLADVGEALIHGHPSDWQGNPNDVLYYHCADTPHTRGFGHPVAVPGSRHVVHAAPRVHPIVPARLLRALGFLAIDDPGWLTALLYRGREVKVAAGTWLMRAGDPGADSLLTIIVAGAAVALAADDAAFTPLGPGDSYGMLAHTARDGSARATLQAIAPCELFVLEAALVAEYAAATGQAARLEAVLALAPILARVPLLAPLDAAARARLAAAARLESYPNGAELAGGDGLAIVLDGALTGAARRDGEITCGTPDSGSGAAIVLPADAALPAAKGATRVLRLTAAQTQALRHAYPAIDQALGAPDAER